MIIGLLDAFKLGNVFTVCFCGGAANIVRAMAMYPQRFQQRHVFHNNVIAEIPKGFEETLQRYDIKVWVSWLEDLDHPRHCVGYKYY